MLDLTYPQVATPSELLQHISDVANDQLNTTSQLTPELARQHLHQAVQELGGPPHPAVKRIKARIKFLDGERDRLQGLVQATRDSTLLPDQEKADRLEVYRMSNELMQNEREQLVDFLTCFPNAQYFPSA